MGVVIAWNDTRTTHEEADVLIAQQMVAVAREQTQFIKVICNDTDVFILLVYMYHVCGLNCSVIMEGLSSQRPVIDIKATVDKHSAIVPQLLGAHALTGYDTVPQMFGIGKSTALKVLSRKYTLEKAWR